MGVAYTKVCSEEYSLKMLPEKGGPWTNKFEQYGILIMYI